MTRALVFDVDGVLVHGYHARPDRQRRWDENLLIDLGVDPDRFREEFIFDIFIKKVVIGEMALIEALDKRLPGLGYKGSPMAFAQYWLANDSTLNTELLDAIRTLKARSDVRLFIATNQDHMRAQWLWQTLGLGEIFEDIFYSARIGMTKAHKGFFAFADERMGRFDQPPLFFDDTQKVIDVAQTAGWDAVLFDTNDQFFAHPWVKARL
ncbi:HAD family hydrolase [Devosia sp. XJ19-1]|uniref:HAD family hydrolase n=1 Tax=Devosia ureilytica TaxID=2952754 RepID=A0A9Q4FR58_9HYPH|nr:HAD family hydrolase [Devosia ureilytica]MCP8883468.1 HAD family hydrolase [Devosia ureilytica]MCP8887076.1 HAD family hydrolase [Devosia ureilytica]